MGAAAAFLIIAIVVSLVVLVVLLATGVVTLTRRGAGNTPVAEDARGTGSLRYAVPRGQDPATVVAALEREGFDAALDPEQAAEGRQVVLVSGPEGTHADRDRARQVLGRDDRADGRVRFLDEA